MSVPAPAADLSRDHSAPTIPPSSHSTASATALPPVSPATPPLPPSASSTTPPTPLPRPSIVASSSSASPLATPSNSSTPGADSSSSAPGPTSNVSVASATSAVPLRKRTLADYKLGRTLGEGSYSTVVSAVDLSNKRDYAIKVLDKRHIIREKKVKYVNIEKNTLYKLDHPGVVKLYSTFQDSSSLYYVLELCQNGELLTFIKKLGSFDENCTRFYVAQILTAVEYVHSQGVIHRDLKPENILLDQRMYIKLTDFGTAKMLEPSEDGTESDRANSFVGTAEYVSPELLTEKAACKSSDLWALGCIIYQLLAGRPPFKGSNEYQTFQKIVKLEYSFPAGFPKTAMDLVSRLLVHDPNERLGANNTIDKLKQHPFFDGVDWLELWKQPAPKLMPYLPPTPAHNTEALRSDHDACLWGVNRTGENLMVVDPFRELGDSGSSVDDSGRNSMNDSDDGHYKNAGVLDANRSSAATSAATSPAHATISTATANATNGLPELSGTGARAVSPLVLSTSGVPVTQGALPKSTSSSTATKPSDHPSPSPSGHAKSKSSSSRNAFVALFSPASKQSSSKSLVGKKTKPDVRSDQVERLVHGAGSDAPKKVEITRENSTVSLAVTANEISAYSRRSQLELQAALSPWQSFLLPTELIIYQTPVLKRKGLFSRSCILVLTDFPRLLYFDDSNHYFSQVFNSNTNEAFSCWQQQQRFIHWEQLEQQHFHHSIQDHLRGLQLETPPSTNNRLYQHPSLSQESQNHQQQQLNALHQPLTQHGLQSKRGAGGTEGPSTARGFLLGRNGSGKHLQQSHGTDNGLLGQSTEGVVPPLQHMSPKSARTSLEYPHPNQHSAHNNQPNNGYNKVDVERQASLGSGSGLEQLGAPIVLPSVSVSSTHSSLTNAPSAASASAANTSLSGSKSNITISACEPTNGLYSGNSSANSSKSSSVAPPATATSPGMIKATKKQAKLRGEILFTASMVSEVKGKKCFFIHTTKKSYYFEESNRDGDAKNWVTVLERCMEEWFGERSGGTGALAGSAVDQSRRNSKLLE